MAVVDFFQLTALPATWQANSLYWIEGANGTTAETYITDASAVPHDTGNTTMITAVAQPLINAALASAANEVQIAANIAARDALALTQNTMVVVTDASADPTVTAGAALYIWDNTAAAYSKLSEFESLDVTVTWGAIVGAPTATPAQLDTAVGQSHTHANKVQLDKVGEDVGGNLLYNGQPVSGITNWNTTNW